MSMPDFRLDGQLAVVTGAAQGNGAAIARTFAAAGARVALADIDGAGAGAVAAEIGGDAMAAGVDVTDLAALRTFAAQVETSLGPASVLVNNAGVIRRMAIDADGYEAEWDALFAVNVAGARNATRAFLGQLTGAGGAIVNLCSIMSTVAGPGMGAYAASKGALAQFTRALAHDLAPRGVRVNALAPGVIATPMTAPTRADDAAIGRFLAHTPMGRVGAPEEVAAAALFLASGAASYVTGASLPVDGGYLAG